LISSDSPRTLYFAPPHRCWHPINQTLIRSLLAGQSGLGYNSAVDTGAKRRTCTIAATNSQETRMLVLRLAGEWIAPWSARSTVYGSHTWQTVGILPGEPMGPWGGDGNRSAGANDCIHCPRTVADGKGGSKFFWVPGLSAPFSVTQSDVATGDEQLYLVSSFQSPEDRPAWCIRAPSESI
jgi:hypothetical protein